MATYHSSADVPSVSSPEVLADISAPSSGLIITETSGTIDNGLFAGWGIVGWDNMGDVGGGQTPIEEHSGYTELSCLNKLSQCRAHTASNGAPFPVNGTSAQDGVFLYFPKLLTGDFSIEISMSNGHPGHSLFGNVGLGLMARRPSDTGDYNADSRIMIASSIGGGGTDSWRPTAMMGGSRFRGTAGSSFTRTNQTWARLDREGDAMRFYWKANLVDPWTELDNPGLKWDVGGSQTQIGLGYGAHSEKNVIRIYSFKITGIEA